MSHDDIDPAGNHLSGDSLSARRLIDRRAVLQGAASLSVLALGTGAAEAQTAPSVTSFSIAVLPDTQFYSRYATTDESQQFQTAYGSTPYDAQTQWIADNASKYGIRFCIHLGDVVDQQNKPNQWIIADAAMKKLENGKVPYSILAGNHDVINDLDYHVPSDQNSGTDAQRTLSSEPYLKTFPSSRAAQQSTFQERDSSGFHECHIFTANGVKFMVLSLSWRVSDNGIAWARDMIDRNPTLPVILSNHALLNIDSDGISPLETDYGKMLWEKLIRDKDQIFMTLNGHFHGAAYLAKTNNYGNPVHHMVVDYQMDYQGGNALMRLYEVDFTNNKIDVMSFSPWVVTKPKATLNQFDRAELTESNQRFSIPINFKTRFARFMRFSPSKALTGPAIIPTVRADLLAGFVEPSTPTIGLPADAEDYPHVADTIAHWRAPSTLSDGQAVQIGGVLPDIVAGNNFARAALVASAQLGDVIWTTDKHRLSSAAGSVMFLNTDNTVGRLNAFLTPSAASVNSQNFANGYTVEAFVKIPAGWNATQHKWGNIMGRSGNRGNIPGFRGGDPEASSILFAISNLREVQWEVVPSSNTTNAQTNWSGEIIRDNWYHVAVVNDPATHTTTLYVDGAPVLRNVGNAATGLAAQTAPQPWILGAGWWNGVLADGYFGGVGEIRLVARPIDRSQWLTARRT